MPFKPLIQYTIPWSQHEFGLFKSFFLSERVKVGTFVQGRIRYTQSSLTASMNSTPPVLSPPHPHPHFPPQGYCLWYCIISFLQPCSMRLSPQLPFNSQHVSFFCITVHVLQRSKQFSKENQTKSSYHKKHPLIPLYTVLVSSSLLDATESYPWAATLKNRVTTAENRFRRWHSPAAKSLALLHGVALDYVCAGLVRQRLLRKLLLPSSVLFCEAFYSVIYCCWRRQIKFISWNIKAPDFFLPICYVSSK